MGDEVDFLHADKHEGFQQVDIITLGVRCQACPKYPKQQVYNIFAISQGNVARHVQITQNNKFAFFFFFFFFFLQYLKKEVSDEIDFLAYR